MRALAAAVLGLGACWGGGGGAPLDAADAPSTGSTWRLEARPITAIYRYRDAAPLAAGRSLRVAIEYETATCDLWAMPTLGYAFEAPDVQVTARVFARAPGCASAGAQVRVMTLALGEGTWTIRAAAPSTAAPLVVTVGPAPGRACGATGGSACAMDCDCNAAAGERCVGAGATGATTTCARPCELDRDCGGLGACVDDDAGAFHACSGGTECDDTYPCGTGFTCTGGACAPSFMLSPDLRHECGGDGDCTPPLRCIDATSGLGPRRCELPCRTGGAWCGAKHECNLADRDVAGLAHSDSICVFAGEWI